jgi:DNA-binding MarR family transcriptional regulator
MKQPKKLLEKSDATPSMFINDISKMFKHAVHRETELEGISHGCQKMLMCLSHKDGITQLDIVKDTHLSAPTVSVALAKMENDGLVIRRPDKHDLRVMRVYITDKGRQTDDFMREKFHETECVMLDGISQQEQEQLVATLRKILRNLVESEEKK